MARKPLDLYATPPAVALAVCRLAARHVSPPAEILEPSAGPGRFVAAARVVWPGARVTAIDVDGAHAEACRAAGARSFVESDWQAYAARMVERRRLTPLVFLPPLLVVGNPPFSRAQAHVEAALEVLHDGEHLVFLLRQSFRGAVERVDFWRRTPLLWISTVVPRVSFVDGGNDMGECEVFCWRKGYRGPAHVLPPMLWGALLEGDLAARNQLELVGRSA
jgi:hypothetical protein